MTVDGEFVDFGAVGAVPRVVLRPLPGEDVPENLLVGGQQPAFDGAGVGVRGQAERRRAGARGGGCGPGTPCRGSGSNQTRPSDSCRQKEFRNDRTGTMCSCWRAWICGFDQ